MHSEIDFNELYASYTAEQLLEVLQNPEQYQEEAIAAAWEVAASKGWKRLLTEKVTAFKKEKQERASEEVNSELKNAHIVHDNCVVTVPRHYLVETWGILVNAGIDFYTTEKYDPRTSGVNFYFLKEDFERAKNLIGD